jgi:putative hemolysin
MHKVLRLNDKPRSSIMTPRPEIHWLDLSRPRQELLDLVAATPHTVYPAADGALDNPVGILSVRDLAAALVRTPDISLRELVKAAVKIPGSSRFLVDRKSASAHL